MVTMGFGSSQKMITTEIGLPQGYSMSPILFTTDLEAALKGVMRKLPKENKHIFEYLCADHLDFIFRSKEDAERCKEII